MATKGIRKDVRFGYFNIRISETYMQQELSKLKKYKTLKTKEQNSEKIKLLEKAKIELSSSILDFSDVFNKLKENKLKNTFDCFNKTIEIDKLTFMPQAIEEKNKDFFFFQIMNSRINQPIKKKINKKREKILLEDDEYIGEFMSMLYNKKSKTFMIQHNRHSLNINRLSFVLSLLYNEYLSKKNKVKYPLILLELQPILNPEQLKKINKNSIYNSIKISGNPVLMSSLIDDNKATTAVSQVLTTFQGYDFEIIIKGEKVGKGIKSLDQENIEDLYKIFCEAENNIVENSTECLPKISVKLQEDEEAPKEVINWFLPKLESTIKFYIDPNKEICHEFVYDKMFEEYNKVKINKIKVGYREEK